MRVAFFGSPEFALPSLEAIHEGHEVVLVVSQPDKPAGRGMRKSSPAVARRARDLDLELEQPASLKRNEEFLARFAALKPDVAVTVAYGKILPGRLLDVPAGGFLNVHASLLPGYRGAAPIQWALINGETTTGVSIMRTDEGLDTGPVCLSEETPIGPDEVAPQLFERLASLGARAIDHALERLSRGELECRPQDESQATLAPLLRKEDGSLDWTQPARALFDRYRGVYAWPGARFSHRGTEVKVKEMRLAEGNGAPGQLLRVGEEALTVAAGSGAVDLITVQPAGKGPMNARDWANGYGLGQGDQLA